MKVYTVLTESRTIQAGIHTTQAESLNGKLRFTAEIGYSEHDESGHWFYYYPIFVWPPDVKLYGSLAVEIDGPYVLILLSYYEGGNFEDRVLARWRVRNGYSALVKAEPGDRLAYRIGQFMRSVAVKENGELELA